MWNEQIRCTPYRSQCRTLTYIHSTHAILPSNGREYSCKASYAGINSASWRSSPTNSHQAQLRANHSIDLLCRLSLNWSNLYSDTDSTRVRKFRTCNPITHQSNEHLRLSSSMIRMYAQVRHRICSTSRHHNLNSGLRTRLKFPFHFLHSTAVTSLADCNVRWRCDSWNVCVSCIECYLHSKSGSVPALRYYLGMHCGTVHMHTFILCT